MCAGEGTPKASDLRLRRKSKPDAEHLERAKEPIAIDAVCVGEHVPDKVAQGICAWLTGCLQRGMTAGQFRSMWNTFLDTEGEGPGDLPGQTGSKRWLDAAPELGEVDLHELYAKAVKSGGDHFIWCDNDAFVRVVALRGDPGVRAIENCVFGEENCKDDAGEWLTAWPPEAGPGAPIAHIRNELAVLRDDTKIRAKSG